ncbi:microcyclamide/patellamide family RiPP [Nostoc linckia FACHB-104]|nr:microcyclamide/patellamide family RiPP [Nostoc linckia FACHB-104]
MDKQNLMPQAARPVNRITTGQLPAELAELSEEALHLHGESSASVLSSGGRCAWQTACGDCWGGFFPPYII